jgi:hypothetical protein
MSKTGDFDTRSKKKGSNISPFMQNNIRKSPLYNAKIGHSKTMNGHAREVERAVQDQYSGRCGVQETVSPQMNTNHCVAQPISNDHPADAQSPYNQAAHYVKNASPGHSPQYVNAHSNQNVNQPTTSPPLIQQQASPESPSTGEPTPSKQKRRRKSQEDKSVPEKRTEKCSFLFPLYPFKENSLMSFPITPISADADDLRIDIDEISKPAGNEDLLIGNVRLFLYKLCDIFIETLCHTSCSISKNGDSGTLALGDIKLALKCEYNLSFPVDYIEERVDECDDEHYKRIAQVARENKGWR